MRVHLQDWSSEVHPVFDLRGYRVGVFNVRDDDGMAETGDILDETLQSVFQVLQGDVFMVLFFKFWSQVVTHQNAGYAQHPAGDGN